MYNLRPAGVDWHGIGPPQLVLVVEVIIYIVLLVNFQPNIFLLILVNTSAQFHLFIYILYVSSRVLFPPFDTSAARLFSFLRLFSVGVSMKFLLVCVSFE